MILAAIDGACRRNGKPDCVAAGGVFLQHFDGDLNPLKYHALAIHEMHSTSQRGEVLALLEALDYAWSAKQQIYFVTDSEYLFNSMTRQWFCNWAAKGWVTALGEPVKNRDLWEAVIYAYRKCETAGIEMMFYYIKGHCIPFGKVTATKLLNADPSGETLFKACLEKYDALKHTKTEALEHALDLSIRNNGFALSEERLRLFVASNLVADAIATLRVDVADKNAGVITTESSTECGSLASLCEKS